MYGAGLVLSFILFYSLIPLDIYDNMFYFLVIVGGALTAACFGGFIFSFDVVKKSENDSNFGCIGGAAVIGVFFISSILYLYNEGEREEKELYKYGVFTEATIVDGSSYKTRKADFTSIKLEYTTEKGQKVRTDCSVGAGEFDNFYQYQTIPVVYSSRYPQILKIFRKQSDLDDFKSEKEKHN